MRPTTSGTPNWTNSATKYRLRSRFAALTTATEVGGDYYDLLPLGETRMGVLVADVSGKGFSAALISMVIHTITRTQEFNHHTTDAIVAKINSVMTSDQDYGKLTKTMSFATIFCGFLCVREKTLHYTNAGHLPMIVFDIDTGKFDFIKANGKPAGIFADEQFHTKTYAFETGKIFIFYSDGITESINNAEEEFGVEIPDDAAEKITTTSRNARASTCSSTRRPAVPSTWARRDSSAAGSPRTPAGCRAPRPMPGRCKNY